MICLLRKLQGEVESCSTLAVDVFKNSQVGSGEVAIVNKIHDKSLNLQLDFALIQFVCPQHVEKLLDTGLKKDSRGRVIPSEINRAFSYVSILDPQSHLAEIARIQLMNIPEVLDSSL